MSTGWREKKRGMRRDQRQADARDDGERAAEESRVDELEVCESPDSIDLLPEQLAEEASDSAHDGEAAGAAILRPASGASKREAPVRQSGIPFARTVRMCGVASGTTSAFVDSHNEIWALGDETLEPICTPARLVTSLATSREGIFVGLADGSINWIDEEGELRVVYGDKKERPIAALAVSAEADELLAATANGTLFLGQMNETRGRWASLHANRRVSAVALSPCGTTLGAASAHGHVRVTSTKAPGRALARIIVDARVVDMAFSKGGCLLAMLLDDGRLPVFRVSDHRRLYERTLAPPYPMSVCFSESDELVGVVADGGRIGSAKLTD